MREKSKHVDAIPDMKAQKMEVIKEIIMYFILSDISHRNEMNDAINEKIGGTATMKDRRTPRSTANVRKLFTIVRKVRPAPGGW